MRKKYFEVAKAVSKTSCYPRIKIGSCIVKKNRVLSVGVNLLKSHPLQKKYNQYRPLDENHIHNNIHAELDAIRKCSKDDLDGATIYIYREDVSGRLKICRPCEACMELIKESGIRVINYTTEDGFCQEVLI